MTRQPNELKNPDFSKMIEVLREYIDTLFSDEAHCDTGSDYEVYIAEAAIQALYGGDVFDKHINPRTEEID